MAATPTELLAVDAKRLEESNQQLGTRIDGLERASHEMRNEFATFRGEVKNDLRWIKGIGAALLAGSGWVIWNAATVTAEVKHQGTRLEKVEKRLDAFAEKIDARLEKVEKRLDAFAEKIDTKLDAILLRDGPKPTGKPQG
jgi:chaperonin cofactor prefoldin